MNRLAADQRPELRGWLQAHRIQWICAVSPHLDDAAFSIATFLAEPGLPPREVWTVFSATTAQGDLAYARAMGFADPLQEFEARRAEDRAAMALLKLPYVHVGAVASQFDAQAAVALATSIRDAARSRAAQGRALVLLPAGAGAELGATARLWRRLMRRPMGCRAHAEHESVRDALGSELGANIDVGYYAECPYLWSEGPEHLGARLKARIGPSLRSLAMQPNVDLRLEVARAYRSQFTSEFGDSPSYQRRSMEGQEWLFLPA